ncbi:hypothetical protein [Photobacterium ganghwense]|uniref:hypothetical protein n=1 Tax=Photobacterium ganghwense TaxID=320778 RepID=UPI0039F030CB
MDNLTQLNTLRAFVLGLMPAAVSHKDDSIVLDALRYNDIRHVCQAIRHTQSDDEHFQHLTLRFGGNSEQSVYRFALSETMRISLDLYSLYLAVRLIRCQLDVYRPATIHAVVVPLQSETVSSPQGQQFLREIYRQHSAAMAHIIPCIQLIHSLPPVPALTQQLHWLRAQSDRLWFELNTPSEHLVYTRAFHPDAIKVSQPLTSEASRDGLEPIAAFTREQQIDFIAGRVGTRQDLHHYRSLGASYYFGYIRDIPSTVREMPLRLVASNN